MVAMCAASCLTTRLWKATDPVEYVAVSQNKISESELQERKVSYRKDDERGLYYVEKTSLRRLGDYTLRALAAPVTVVLDAAMAIVVVGAASGATVGAALGMDELERLDRKSGGQGCRGVGPTCR